MRRLGVGCLFHKITKEANSEAKTHRRRRRRKWCRHTPVVMTLTIEEGFRANFLRAMREMHPNPEHILATQFSTSEPPVLSRPVSHSVSQSQCVYCAASLRFWFSRLPLGVSLSTRRALNSHRRSLLPARTNQRTLIPCSSQPTTT